MTAINKMDTSNLGEENTRFVNTIRDAYITVYGVEKWNSFTAKEQHDCVMYIIKDLNRTFIG